MVSRSSFFIFIAAFTSLAVSGFSFTNGKIPSDQVYALYDQPVDPNGKILQSSWLDPDGSDFDIYIWDDFTLLADQTVSVVQWHGGYDPLQMGRGGAVVDFTVAIYPSIATGTEPDVANPPLVEYQTGGNANETSIGVVNGIPMYVYQFNLPSSFQATGDTKYWIQIEAFQHGISPDWGFASSLTGSGRHYQRGSGAGGDILFRSVPGDIAFTLLGSFPEPATSTIPASATDTPTIVSTIAPAETDTPTPANIPTETHTPTPVPSPQVPCFSPLVALMMALLFIFKLPKI